MLAEKDFGFREASCFIYTCNQLEPQVALLGDSLTLLQFCGTGVCAVLAESSFSSPDSLEFPSPGQKES